MDPQQPALESAGDAATRKSKPAGAQANWLLKRALGSLPESEQFESAAQRDEAIGEMHGEISRQRGLDLWIGIAILIAVLVPVFIAMRVLLRTISLHPILEDIIKFGVLGSTAGVTLWFLWRWGAICVRN